MTSKGSVAARVDVNSKIGLGHLTRCVTLLKQLCIDGFNAQLISRYRFCQDIESLFKEIPVSWLEDVKNIENQKLENEVRDAEETLSIIGRSPTGLSWVVVDHYDLGEKWEKLIGEAGHKVLAIDDFRNRRHFADILVSDTSEPFDPSFNGFPGKTCELTGTKFALVDPDFAYSKDMASSVKSKKRVLVTYGGSDPTEETGKALEAVRLLRKNDRYSKLLGTVDVVIGYANAKAQDLIRLAKGLENVIVHDAPESLAPLMRKVDIILTAGGNSMVEGVTMRRPCLITITSDNQSMMVAQMLKKGAIISLDKHSTVGPLDVAEAVIKILFEYEQLNNCIRASAIFDHSGACRISSAIQTVSIDKSSNYN